MEHKLPEYLTLPEVVKILKVHPNTLRNWDKDGTLPVIRIGKRNIRRWKKTDVIHFLQTANKSIDNVVKERSR